MRITAGCTPRRLVARVSSTSDVDANVSREASGDRPPVARKISQGSTCAAIFSLRCAARDLLVSEAMLVALALAGLFARSAHESVDAWRVAMSAADCPALFGSVESKARNRAARERRDVKVHVGELAIDFSYGGAPWTGPALLSYRDVRVQ